MFKVALVKSLFKGIKGQFPQHKHIDALRKKMNKYFPKLLGYGKLYKCTVTFGEQKRSNLLG